MSCATTRSQAKRAGKQVGVTPSADAALAERQRQLDFFGPAAAQLPFFDEPLPRDTVLPVEQAFSPDQLQQVSIQLLLGEAAVKRHLRQTRSDTLSPDQRDPRPLDWAQSDRNCYDVLIKALRQARQGSGGLDVSDLNPDQRLELWAFSSHEAERLLRQLDPLQAGGFGGATAAYLTRNHQLLARFYGWLAGQLEPLLPQADVAEFQAWRSL